MRAGSIETDRAMHNAQIPRRSRCWCPASALQRVVLCFLFGRTSSSSAGPTCPLYLVLNRSERSGGCWWCSRAHTGGPDSRRWAATTQPQCHVTIPDRTI